MLPVGFRLPLDICPSMSVVLAVLAGAEVVAQPWFASSKHSVVNPGRISRRRHCHVPIAIIEASPTSPAGSALSVLHIVHFVRAHSYVDIRTFVREDVLHAAPLRTVSAILRPDECLLGFDAAEFLAILDPGSMVLTVFFDIGSVWHDSREELRNMVVHGREWWM